MQMGDIGPCDESIFEAADYKPCRISPFHGHAFVGEDQLNCRHKEIIKMDLLMKNLGISDEGDQNDLLLEECENLHIKKTICSPISDKRTLQFSSNISELKDLSKCAAILCSETLQPCSSIFAKVELSTIELGFESYVAASNDAEDSLVPYHESSKFMSAIKGSRAKQGKALDPNVRVTWAANVYDPPVTSSSHTVKGHRHRLPKAKTWDHNKHKHMKAKPSNGGSGDRKKHSHRRSSSSILDPRMGRMQALSRRSQETGHALDIGAASDQESSSSSSSNCAGSFHAKSPWPLPLPIAEAS